jgi:hypothetical protein
MHTAWQRLTIGDKSWMLVGDKVELYYLLIIYTIKVGTVLPTDS